MTRTPRKRSERPLYAPAEYRVEVLRSMQTLALYAQQAEIPPEPGQEQPVPAPLDVKRVLDWIIYEAAATYQNGFLPNDDNGRIGAFMDGRQQVGQQIVTAMKIKPSVLEDKE